MVATVVLHGLVGLALFWTSRAPRTHPAEIEVSLTAAVSVSVHTRPPPASEPIQPIRLAFQLPKTEIARILLPETSEAAIVNEAPVLSQYAPAKEAPDPPLPPKPKPTPDDYVSRIAIKLAGVQHYPVDARLSRRVGVVVLAFRLDRFGQVLSSRVARSSGVRSLDLEAQQMLIRAAPFAPFSTSMPEAERDFEVPVEFSLR